MYEYVGFDVSKEETSFCVKVVSGAILAHITMATDPKALCAERGQFNLFSTRRQIALALPDLNSYCLRVAHHTFSESRGAKGFCAGSIAL